MSDSKLIVIESADDYGDDDDYDDNDDDGDELAEEGEIVEEVKNTDV